MQTVFITCYNGNTDNSFKLGDLFGHCRLGYVERLRNTGNQFQFSQSANDAQMADGDSLGKFVAIDCLVLLQ